MRLNVRQDLRDRLNKAVPGGLRGALISSTLELVVCSIEKNGPIVLGAIIAGKMRIEYDEGETHASSK